jgi:hypothetical protein
VVISNCGTELRLNYTDSSFLRFIAWDVPR